MGNKIMSHRNDTHDMHDKIKLFIKDSSLEKTEYLENYPNCYEFEPEERRVKNCLYYPDDYDKLEDKCKLRLNTISKPWSSNFGYIYKFKNNNNVEIRNFKGKNIESIILKIEISTNKNNNESLDYDIEGGCKSITDINSLLKESKIQNDILTETKEYGIPICPEIYLAGYLKKNDFLKVFEENNEIKNIFTSDLKLIFECIRKQINIEEYITDCQDPISSILKYKSFDCNPENFLYISYCFMEYIEGKHLKELDKDIVILDNDNTILNEDKKQFKIKDKKLLYIGETQHISGILPLLNFEKQLKLLHSAGYYHNDLKDDNILYNYDEIYDDLQGYTWMIDFGLSKHINDINKDSKYVREAKLPNNVIDKIKKKISQIISPLNYNSFKEKGLEFLKNKKLTLYNNDNNSIIQEQARFTLDNHPTDDIYKNIISCENVVTEIKDIQQYIGLIQLYLRTDWRKGSEKNRLKDFLVKNFNNELKKNEAEIRKIIRMPLWHRRHQINKQTLEKSNNKIKQITELAAVIGITFKFDEELQKEMLRVNAEIDEISSSSSEPRRSSRSEPRRSSRSGPRRSSRGAKLSIGGKRIVNKNK